ncbi:MAG: hypothetical protein AAGG59_08085 [Bacteroidota bacterium]
MKIILSCLILCLSFSSGYAQDSLATTNTERIQFLMDRLDSELALTASQKKALQTMFEKRYAEKDSLKGQSFKAMNSQTRTRLSQILEKAQYQKYLKLRTERQRQKAKYLEDHPDYKFSKEDEELDF